MGKGNCFQNDLSKVGKYSTLQNKIHKDMIKIYKEILINKYKKVNKKK